MKPIAAALLVVIACPGTKDAAQKTLTAVKVRQLAPAAAGQASRYSATINAASRVELAYRLGGYVEQVAQVKGVDGKPRPLQEGDRVKKGQPLARVRITDYQQKLAEATAALSEAVAARAQTARDLARASKLYESGSIPKSDLDQARTRAQAANARAQGASARVAEAKTALGDAALESPIDGVILKKNLELGNLVPPGIPVFSIADTSSVKVQFGVADTELEKLSVGAAQAVTTEAYRGQTFEGKISKIAPAADAKSRVFEVEVTIPNPDDKLKVGMVAALALPAGGTKEPPAPLVPLTAVVRSPSNPKGFAVYVVDGAVARVRDVELGGFVGNAIPVKAGLKEGEQVVVLGASLLSDGMPVEIIP